MAILKISIDNLAPNTQVKNNLGVLKVKIGDFSSMPAPISVIASDLISNDIDNQITKGSDGKLLASHPDIDFTAYYTLAKG